MTRFRDLHRPGRPFILVNVWDIGTARMAAALGAEAIATSSAAHAFTLGRPDMGHVTRDEALAHAEALVAAVDIPVSGDFENGFGATPETCAETVRFAAEAGLAGLSIEDTDLPGSTAYDPDLAVERIRAAASMAGHLRARGRDMVLVARADGVMNGAYGIDEALRRIQAFDRAGADCLYVPMPGGQAELARIVAATEKPVNALAAGPWTGCTRADFARLGVARISLGSALARATHKLVHDAVAAMLTEGDFSGLADTLPGDIADRMLGDPRFRSGD